MGVRRKRSADYGLNSSGSEQGLLAALLNTVMNLGFRKVLGIS
jgi:hypothetical protein